LATCTAKAAPADEARAVRHARRREAPAPEELKRGRGREGEPTEWTGSVSSRKWEIEVNPDLISMTAGTSFGNETEVIGAQAAQKSR
jgi:hypothetical protein